METKFYTMKRALKLRDNYLRNEDELLRTEYNKLKERREKGENIAISTLNAIVEKVKKSNRQFYELKEERKNYDEAFNAYVTLRLESIKNRDNADLAAQAEEVLEKLITLHNELAKKYDKKLVISNELEPIDFIKDEELENQTPSQSLVVAEQPVKPIKKGKKKKLGIIAGVLAAVALLAAAYGIGKSSKDEQVVKNPESAIEDVIDKPEQDNIEGVIIEEKPFKSYGEFTDASNQEQVEERANEIINTYYAPFMDQLPENMKSLITVDNIANVIRVMNGELPLDENGNRTYGANTVDDYANLFVNLTADIPSAPALGDVHNVPAYVFAEDNSELADYIYNYDVEYANIAKGRNEQSAEITRTAIANLGEKFWNEWTLQGMHGDNNPYLFPAEQRLFAYLGSFGKYGTYAFEYNLNAMQPVCIEACIDYSTKEKEELSVNEIFVGYTSGQYDTVIAKAAGIDADKEPDSVAFTQDLQEGLDYKYSKIAQRIL